MKVIITDYSDFSEISIQDGVRTRTFDCVDHQAAVDFWRGFRAAQDVINSLVQSLPMNYETVDKTHEA